MKKLLALGLAAAAFLPLPALAEYPEKPVQFVVPWPPGDLEDVLASIGSQRISLTPDSPTVSELAPELNVALWNGLFVRKDVPQDARNKIAVVAQKVMTSQAARDLSAQTGALIYWQDADASAARIASDMETMARINKMLGE